MIAWKSDLFKLEAMEHRSCSLWAKLLDNNLEWIYSPSLGSAGRMMIAWKSDRFKLEAVEHGSYLLWLNFQTIVQISWWISCIYGPASNFMARGHWVELNDLSNLSEGAWCICGDFSEVLYSEDRSGNSQSYTHKMTIHDWISEFGLIYLTIQNIQYTWSNSRASMACSELDRFLISPHWSFRFSYASLRVLPRPISNCCPLVLEMELPKNGPHPFRFRNM